MNEILSDVRRAKDGKVLTIPFIHKKLSKYIFIGQRLYHLIGGAGGSGKSAWVDLNYAINPAIWMAKYGQQEDIKLKIILRSMERSKKHRIAKWVCMRLYIDHGILIDVPSLFGWGLKKNYISDELYEKIRGAVEQTEQLEDIIEVVDGIDHPTGIYTHLRKEALSKGTLFRYTDEDVFVKQRGSSISKA